MAGLRGRVEDPWKTGVSVTRLQANLSGPASGRDANMSRQGLGHGLTVRPRAVSVSPYDISWHRLEGDIKKSERQCPHLLDSNLWQVNT